MAVWQFQFTLVPEAGIRRVHKVDIDVLPEDCARDPDAPIREDVSYENYWQGLELLPIVSKELEQLLPERVSWSRSARMFGSEDGDSIEIWDDDIYCAMDTNITGHPPS